VIFIAVVYFIIVVVPGSVVDPVHNGPPDPPRSPDQPRKIAYVFE
jgi:hypothetical protein